VNWVRLCIFALAPVCALAQDDVLLQALRDEMQRSMTLKLQNLEPPYYISYELDDVREVTASATLGGLLGSNEGHFRVPHVHVRVGDPKFDNTNYVGSGFNFGPRYDVRLPLDNSYQLVRQDLWLATDQAYKSALEAISRKRAALKNISVTEQLSDFAPAEPTKLLEPIKFAALTLNPWVERTRRLSEIFLDFPKLKTSGIELSLIDGMHYFVNSEGSEVRIHDGLGVMRVRAYAQAADGMTLRDSVVFEARDPNRLPSEPEMKRAIQAMAQNVTAMAQAPMGETYSGPVLFEGVAAAQVFAEVLGRNLALTRKPVLERNMPGAIPVSDLEGRKGARILPEFFNVVDDPDQTEWHGQPLFGSYLVDDEAVKPAALPIVEKGVLQNFLLTRQPVRGFDRSNGHARLAGAFGAKTATIGNLFISASETSTVPELKRKLIDFCKQRDKPYGIVVRKMDFPSSATVEEARRILSGAGSGGGHTVSIPLLVYRVYPDGREELVRGMRFRGLNVRSLKDILAAGNDSNLFDYMENNAPFALMGAGSEAAESSVIAPSILVDDLEMLKMEDEQPKLPIVPSPTITRTGGAQAVARK
jgi:TldD protein